MTSFAQWQFTMPEIVALAGLAQCLYVLVYMSFHAGKLGQTFLPALYFLMMAAAFFLDFAADFIGANITLYFAMEWIAWFMAIPLSVLLMVQVASLDIKVARRFHWSVWGFFIAFGAAFTMALRDDTCNFPESCAILEEWLVVLSTAAGAIVLGGLWLKRDIFEGLKKQRGGRDRYWLVMILILADLSFLFFMLAGMSRIIAPEETIWIRTIMGLAFVYLAGTGLFRIYPQALPLVKQRNRRRPLNDEEQALIVKIDNFLDREKIYHEPSYGRSDLAQELGVPESLLSKVINAHYGKSLPQLLNEKRVAEAQYFLRETDISIKHIAEECGFSSLSTFNRVFRGELGVAPSEYRNQLK